MLIDILDNKNLLNYDFFNYDFVSFDFKNNPYKKYILYVDNNYILGFLCYEYIFDRYEIDNIYVDTLNRRKGLGYKMINYLIEKGKKDNIKNITLEVNKNNNQAISLYKKVGFTQKAIRPRYYNGIDGILMEKEMM